MHWNARARQARRTRACKRPGRNEQYTVVRRTRRIYKNPALDALSPLGAVRRIVEFSGLPFGKVHQPGGNDPAGIQFYVRHEALVSFDEGPGDELRQGDPF